MARMITLNPAPKVQVPGGAWDLLAVDAGRYSQGLRSTLQLWNGAMQYSACVNLNDITAFVQTIATKCGVASDLMERAVLDLSDMVEGVYRQMTSSPVAQGARPPDYRSTPEGLVLLKMTANGPAPTLLTNFTATIVADIAEDDGSGETRRLFTLDTQRAGQSTQVQVPAGHFAGMSWVTEHLGPSALVMPGVSLKDHAHTAIRLLSGAIPSRHVYTHLGWRQIAGAWVYLHAGGALGANGPLADVDVRLERVLARYHLQSPDTPDTVRHAVQASLQLVDLGPDVVTFPVYSALWRSVLGHVDHSLHLTGKTGAGKTALAALLQQHFGAAMDAEGLPAPWSSTGNAFEGLAFLAKDALLVIDDFCPTGAAADIHRSYRDADRVFRAGGNTSARQRMRPDGTLRPPRPPRGLIVSTGEDIPPGHSLRARVLVLEVPQDLLQANKQAFTTCQAQARTGLYTQALAGFLQWVAPHYDAIQQSLPQDVAILRNTAAQAGHLRTPGIVAQLGLGLQTFLAYASDIGALSSTEREALWQRGWTALNEAAVQQYTYQETEDEVTRFLTALAGALAAGDAHVADAKHPGEPCAWPAWGWRQEISDSENDLGQHRITTTWRALGRCMGWREGDRLYLDPEAAYSIADRFASTQKRALPLSAQTLWKRMHERGLLKRDPSQDKNKVKRTIGGERKYVLDVAATLFETL
jgi:Domain of unknown function (DUF927)